MPSSRRSIGGQGLEQGGSDLGNDYSRNITRESQQDDSSGIIIGKDKKEKESTEQNKDNNGELPDQTVQQEQKETD